MGAGPIGSAPFPLTHTEPHPYRTAPMNLTESQQAAVMSRHQNRLIVAGPGSGKTHTTIAAIRHDIELMDEAGDRDAQERVIAITFTHAGAEKLREKLHHEGILPFHVGTLHSFCLRVVQYFTPGNRIAMLTPEVAAATIMSIAQGLRVKGLTAEGLQQYMAGLRNAGTDYELVANAYRKQLRQAGAADFNTILEQALELMPRFTTEKGWLLYVDEFQDSAPIDLKLYRALWCQRRWVVGDPDQNIFSFRGATLDNIMELAKSPTWEVCYLEDNFRSGSTILWAAQELIALNKNRLKVRQTARMPWQGQIRSTVHETEVHEVVDIITWIEEHPGEELAILCRYNANREQIEKALRLAKVDLPDPPPPLPKDFQLGCAVLALLANPTSRLAHHAVLRGMYGEKKTQELIERDSAAVPKTWSDEILMWRDMADTLKGFGLSRDFLFLAHRASQEGDTLDPAAILIGIRPTVEPRNAKIRILTMHGAKGLEFDNVWLAAIDLATTPHDIEEERRLFYVAITRARKSLILTSARTRTNQYTGRPEDRILSPFLTSTTEPKS